MASWLSVLDSDYEAADESDFEGEGIAGYLPEVLDNFLEGADDDGGAFEEGDEVPKVLLALIQVGQVV